MSKINLLKPIINLSSTNRIILDSVRKFCRTELLDRLKSNKINNKEIYKEYGKMGLLGPTIKNYNCLGTSYKMYGLIAKEIEYVDSGFRSMYSVQSSLVMNPIYKYGSEEVKNKYLERLNSGDFIGCFGLTEADSGSDANNMKTNAKYNNGKFILNGSKTWITNAPIADVFLVWAKLDGKVNGFVINKDTKGLETVEIKDKMSLNSSQTGMIFLNNVEVEESQRLNIEGMKGPLSCLNDARLGISFGVLGASEFCIETALDYADNRNLFDNKLSGKQLFQNKIVDMITEYNLGLLASLEVSEKVDGGESIPEMISLIKRNNCSKSLDIARTSRDILGGNGITKDYNIFRHMVNLETVNTYEGTYDIHTLILGSYFTGIKSF